MFQNLVAQKIKILSDSVQSSLRGLSVVTNKIIWVSGSNGMVGKSVDAGITWKWLQVKGFEKTEFRDIEAFDGKSAIVLGVGEPAFLLKTRDGGDSWKVVYRNETKGMFLDAMAFSDDKHGIVVGDPIDGRFFIVKTSDNGETWQSVPTMKRPAADIGEACFASSGTNVRTLNRYDAVFVSGGLSSHIFLNDRKILLPLLKGKESTGANSIAVKNRKTMIVVGGDFLQKDLAKGNSVFTVDGGNSWSRPKTPPTGYRSCVEYLSGQNWITCGLNGVDVSHDDGIHWERISDEGFHVCRKAKNGTAVYLAGNGGRVARLQQ